MLKLLSATAVASVIIAATLVSSVTAAQINVSTGHFNSVGRSGEFAGSRGDFARGEPNFAAPVTPNMSKQRRWVCGPIVNYDGTPHCHWTL
jgi:hypothetical protein